jgi:Flp pilus assembly protein protease CpaA
MDIMSSRDASGRLIAGLIFASVIGIPVAGYNCTTAGLVFIVHTATLVCLVAKPPRKGTKSEENFEIV